ncbi:hypothetical protein BJX63DRAFT_412107 [Aspergillus granulosus]|uniref:MFS transporter n=1 Tax=Aspergillus granulosus TaxID=176169 RepID=A0ABR4GWI9_9EURO
MNIKQPDTTMHTQKIPCLFTFISIMILNSSALLGILAPRILAELYNQSYRP